MTGSDWDAEFEADTASLKPSQVKALPLVALQYHDDPAALRDDLATVEQLLLEMSRARGASTPQVLERAARPTMSVPELTRIKELAKRLIREATTRISGTRHSCSITSAWPRRSSITTR